MYYFGERGAEENTLLTDPAHNYLFKIVQSSGFERHLHGSCYYP